MLEHLADRQKYLEEAPGDEYFPDYFITGVGFCVTTLPGAPDASVCHFYKQMDLVGDWSEKRRLAYREIELILHRMQWLFVRENRIRPQTKVTYHMFSELVAYQAKYWGDAALTNLEEYWDAYNYLMDEAACILDRADEDESSDEDDDDEEDEN